MIYKVDIPGYVDIGTAHSVTELVKVLQDGQCIRKMTVQMLCHILDKLEEEGIFHAKMADDSKPHFYIRRKEE